MPKRVIIDGEQIINATDWEAKSKEIIRRLDEELFQNINYADCYKYKYDKEGNEIAREKRAVKKGEIMPTISPAQVTTKLNRFLRIYRPMNLEDAKSLEDTDFLEAYGYFLDIISHINTYCTFLPDKQLFSAFCNISTNIYNELLVDPRYTQVFASIEDGFVQSNFTVAQAGLIDSKTTIAKLQAKEAGHSLKPASETINFVQNNHIDKALIHAQLDKFSAMLPQKGGKK